MEAFSRFPLLKIKSKRVSEKGFHFRFQTLIDLAIRNVSSAQFIKLINKQQGKRERKRMEKRNENRLMIDSSLLPSSELIFFSGEFLTQSRCNGIRLVTIGTNNKSSTIFFIPSIYVDSPPIIAFKGYSKNWDHFSIRVSNSLNRALVSFLNMFPVRDLGSFIRRNVKRWFYVFENYCKKNDFYIKI